MAPVRFAKARTRATTSTSTSTTTTGMTAIATMAATATTTTGKRTRPAMATITVKAKCPDNQDALDRLVTLKCQRSAADKSDRYVFTLKRGIEALMQCPDAVTSYQAAMALKGVGPHLAKMICPPSAAESAAAGDRTASAASKSKTMADTTTTRTKAVSDKPRAQKRKSPPDASAAPCSSINNNPHDDDDSDNDHDNQSLIAGQSAASLNGLSQQSQSSSLHSDAMCFLPNHHGNDGKVAGAASRMVAADRPSVKQAKYQAACQSADKQSWKDKGLYWKVVLIIDGREPASDHIQAKCQMSGIPCEERHLIIGDMAWIAQGYRVAAEHQDDVLVEELMLGTIIERKTPEDLKASLFGTRYWEQRMRMQHSGLAQLFLLIEGDFTDLYRCPAETLHTAMWETRLYLQFQIVQTRHMDGTVMALKRMHRRILQRSFPSAFGGATNQEGLPTFTEVSSSTSLQQRHTATTPTSLRTTDHYQHRRHVRRRLQSLMAMTFDVDPVPPLGMPRFITYQELKCKIERDREAGTKTVGSIHAAMLKQVAGLDRQKITAIVSQYPTPQQLLHAWHSDATPTIAARQQLVADLSTGRPNQRTAHDRTVGPRSSAELYLAYGMEGVPETRPLEQDDTNDNFNNNDTNSIHINPRSDDRTTSYRSLSAQQCNNNGKDKAKTIDSVQMPHLQQQQQEEQQNANENDTGSGSRVFVLPQATSATSSEDAGRKSPDSDGGGLVKDDNKDDRWWEQPNDYDSDSNDCIGRFNEVGPKSVSSNRGNPHAQIDCDVGSTSPLSKKVETCVDLTLSPFMDHEELEIDTMPSSSKCSLSNVSSVTNRFQQSATDLMRSNADNFKNDHGNAARLGKISDLLPPLSSDDDDDDVDDDNDDHDDRSRNDKDMAKLSNLKMTRDRISALKMDTTALIRLSKAKKMLSASRIATKDWYSSSNSSSDDETTQLFLGNPIISSLSSSLLSQQQPSETSFKNSIVNVVAPSTVPRQSNDHVIELVEIDDDDDDEQQSE